jgi:hypothetical protein
MFFNKVLPLGGGGVFVCVTEVILKSEIKQCPELSHSGKVTSSSVYTRGVRASNLGLKASSFEVVVVVFFCLSGSVYLCDLSRCVRYTECFVLHYLL